MSASRASLFAVCIAAVAALSLPLGAADQNPSLPKVDWIKGPAKADLRQIAEIQVPEGFIFTGPAGTRRLLEKWGNPTSGQELGLLAPTSVTWVVVFEFSDVGYVKDTEKDKLDADKILKAIKAGNDQANEWRKKRGAATMNIVGWEQPPRYNEETHNLEWAIRGESEGAKVINYNTRLLGRKGVMEVNLIIDPDKLAETLPAYQEILTAYSFKGGERYAEYRPGDKLAKYGLTALIAGGAAAVAVKTGLFATLALLFKKAWKLIVIGVVAVAGFIKKVLFGAGSPKTASE